MASDKNKTKGRGLIAYLRAHWLTMAGSLLRGLVLLSVVTLVVDGLFGQQSGRAARLNALIVATLCVVSAAYLLYVSGRVHLRLPGMELKEGETATVQVVRLSTDAARAVVANEAGLPVLRAQTTLTLSREGSGDARSASEATLFAGESFSLGAHGERAAGLARTFDHVGIYRLESAGVRVYDLLGIASRTREAPGRWRVRVVPNIYRLAYGIPVDRMVSQDSLGIPSTPADALDYDRVRDYQPGDPLKTIHWKVVAHGQGELYTKLFETPTITSFTLALDPYGADVGLGDADVALHLHDTMLEGGLSLVEHAYENGIPGTLRYANQDDALVQVSWQGPGMRGTLVETALRPSQSAEASRLSLDLIRSLRTTRAGYAVFATSSLTQASVGALIACHHAGVPLLVVHALPGPMTAEGRRQRDFDRTLQKEAIAVAGIRDGSQIVREVDAP